MTRVGFYVIQQAGEARRLQVAARLADKAFQRGHRIYIHARDQDQARALDTLLWGFRPSSFLPHGLAGDPGSENQDGRGRDSAGCRHIQREKARQAQGAFNHTAITSNESDGTHAAR